ncbi:hypothetical protein [Streptantibioticus silvisoli]|uniref:Uncharacterized protein n=1 Tax=Streptantibioticus silvisoli TaxID=2705255 RepID=A0ABT6W4U3_9ACTN|nr:hypothetical protein [Streptantibioticus silvisoli]MDI5965775.1 hypothetical protein [Streptantibioticus silvisoli]
MTIDDQRARLVAYLTQAGLSTRRAQANIETLLATAAATGHDGQHQYLSTGCLHGDMRLPDGRTGHQYCQGETGVCGAKTPASCKFCRTPCQCPCHLDKETP